MARHIPPLNKVNRKVETIVVIMSVLSHYHPSPLILPTSHDKKLSAVLILILIKFYHSELISVLWVPYWSSPAVYSSIRLSPL